MKERLSKLKEEPEVGKALGLLLGSEGYNIRDEDAIKFIDAYISSSSTILSYEDNDVMAVFFSGTELVGKIKDIVEKEIDGGPIKWYLSFDLNEKENEVIKELLKITDNKLVAGIEFLSVTDIVSASSYLRDIVKSEKGNIVFANHRDIEIGHFVLMFDNEYGFKAEFDENEPSILKVPISFNPRWERVGVLKIVTIAEALKAFSDSRVRENVKNGLGVNIKFIK